MKIIKWMPVIGIALLAYILFKIGIKNLVAAFAGANYFYVFLMFLTFPPLLMLQAYKWDILLKRQKINFSFMHLLGLQTISIFYEFVTPARIGSFIKIAYLQEKIHNLGKSASSVVIDRALDFLVVAFLAFLGSLSLLGGKLNIFYVCIGIFLLFLLGFIVLMNKRIMRFFAGIFYKLLLPKKFKRGAKKSFKDFYRNMPPAGIILALFAITAVFWILVYSQAYLSALAFHVNVPYSKFIVIFPISVIISLVPISISGLGTREAVLLNLLGSIAEKQNIVAFSLFWSVSSLVVYSILGLWLIFKKGFNIGKK
ncbi:MAG: lysylphosphatidylglycerol synthase transmembrane domain-containing protein [archaeon]